ncbi:MAG TPA: phosphatase PAP2 family protein [Pyrinomonadaceae bacterium]|jgi:undecaprenyl-diphosphatase
MEQESDKPTTTDAPHNSTTTDAPLPDSAPLDSPAEATERRRATRRILRAEFFYLFGLAAFTVLASFAYFYAYFGWDFRAAQAVQSLSVPGVAELMRFTSVFGNGWTPYAMTAATMFVFILMRRRSEAAGIVLSAAGGGLLNALLKTLIHRPRPDPILVKVLSVQRSLSFPSGHVMFYVCYFGFLFFVAYALLPRGSNVRRLTLTLAALPVLLIGFSRVYLGAHWPSDTLGAYLIGSLWLAFSLDMYRRWKQRATFKKLSADTNVTE